MILSLVVGSEMNALHIYSWTSLMTVRSFVFIVFKLSVRRRKLSVRHNFGDVGRFFDMSLSYRRWFSYNIPLVCSWLWLHCFYFHRNGCLKLWSFDLLWLSFCVCALFSATAFNGLTQILLFENLYVILQLIIWNSLINMFRSIKNNNE